MPNIIEHRVGALGDKAPSAAPGDQVGIYILTSNRKSVVVTRAQIAARFTAEVGSRTVRRAAVITWLRGRMESVLGAEMLSANDLTFDFNDADGSPLNFEARGR